MRERHIVYASCTPIFACSVGAVCFKQRLITLHVPFFFPTADRYSEKPPEEGLLGDPAEVMRIEANCAHIDTF